MSCAEHVQQDTKHLGATLSGSSLKTRGTALLSQQRRRKSNPRLSGIRAMLSSVDLERKL